MARRRCAIALSCPSMPANASAGAAAVAGRSAAMDGLAPVQQLADGARDVGLEHVGIAIRRQDEHAALVGARDLEVALAHAAVEVQVHLLESIELPAPDAPDAHRGVEV